VTAPPRTDLFPREIAGLPLSGQPEIVELSHGDAFDLRIDPVVKRIGEATARMLAYNGSIPGPTLKVRQGSEVIVNVANQGDLEATVHWHGVRVENRFDGTHETQAPIPIGGNFTYRLQFPDPGVYWYQPHIREDRAREMGLYGNILVVPTDGEYWAPVDRELLLTLDDLLLEDGQIAPFNARFGEVLRLYLTNTANTRVFHIGLHGAQMKLVGGDRGRCEREELVDEVVLAPSERAVVDVLFDKPGRITLEHRDCERCYALAAITVSEDWAVPSLAPQFEFPRASADMAAERQRIGPFLGAAPDKTLAFAIGATGAENRAIDWRFQVGDRVKLRLVNEMDSNHPFHIHGAGRFLILARDGQAEANLVWKDTVLVRTGQTVDLLLDVTDPGLWMAHRHGRTTRQH